MPHNRLSCLNIPIGNVIMNFFRSHYFRHCYNLSPKWVDFESGCLDRLIPIPCQCLRTPSMPRMFDSAIDHCLWSGIHTGLMHESLCAKWERQIQVIFGAHLSCNLRKRIPVMWALFPANNMFWLIHSRVRQVPWNCLQGHQRLQKKRVYIFPF